MPKPPPDLYDEMHTKSDSTGLFLGIIVALSLLAIVYLVFEANSSPAASARPLVITIDRVYVDPATGCEYLGITGAIQRLDRDGKQICRPLETK